ncbi:oocyte zinc finger protein XlCOF6 [Aplysia californica]|uniref:Oocyte zinc finger protein XlCOF6 n=1 Tax=Aplysia californica TaxID=6500 RepID=A0ABM0JV62_APLCA|nr:oocyte zinc finger protein XlCOF6 [Aplysia californica]XP_035826650.1 oocyte zinc finger protein XlCOF6 [Aplysia californica]
MTEETMQYQIEVQEGSGNGEVIIIYNCDSEEITPELLANTLTELSKQAATQQTATKLPSENDQSQPQEYILSQDMADTSGQFELSLVDLPSVKVEEPGTQSVTIEGSQFQNEIFLETPLEVKDERLDEAVGLETGLSNSVTEQIQILGGLKPELEPAFEGQATNTLTHFLVGEEAKEQQFVGTDEEANATQSCDNSTNDKRYDVLPSTTSENESAPLEVKEEPVLYSCHHCDYFSRVELEVQRHLKNEHNEEEPFRCSICHKTFKVELSLQIHSLMHGGSADSPTPDIDFGFNVKKIYTCPLCDFEYKSKIKITNHVKKEHKGETVYRCSKCPYACLTSEELKSHETSPKHDDEMKTLCPQCGISCKNIRRHIKIAHNNSRPYLCTDCGFRAKSITNLNAHTVIHSEVKEVKCSLCDYRCHTKNQLDRHMVRHSSVKKFKCSFPDCAFACKTQGSLKRHTQIHTSGIKYACPICDYYARDRADLKKHKISQHPRNVSYDCKECGMSFERVAELKKHSLAIHRSNKICFCAYCDYSCETPQELRDHMQIHYGKYSFICNVCGYTCRLKSLYKRHMARHNKDKKFACPTCNYACAEKADLQKHLTSKHSQEKPYACPHCNYKCKFQARLNNHIAYVHSDLKPYFCKLCPYTGKSAENLRKHLGTHSGLVKTIQCVLCDYATAEKAKLKRHMQVHIKRAVFQ